jgi:hypothetical protein
LQMPIHLLLQLQLQLLLRTLLRTRRWCYCDCGRCCSCGRCACYCRCGRCCCDCYCRRWFTCSCMSWWVTPSRKRSHRFGGLFTRTIRSKY